jgi:hypothetical protein
MATVNTINLIRTKTGSSQQLDAIQASLRKTGYIGLTIFVCVGILIGVLYLLFSAEERNLTAQKKELITRLQRDAVREGYFRSIKDRTTIVSKTMSSKRPWAELLDKVNAVVAPPSLTRISVDEQNKVSITVSVPTVDLVLPVVNGLINETRNKHITKPQMTSLQFGKNGAITASFSFGAVF